MFLPPVWESSETNTVVCFLALPGLRAHCGRSRAGWVPVKAGSKALQRPLCGSGPATGFLSLRLNNRLRFGALCMVLERGKLNQVN